MPLNHNSRFNELTDTQFSLIGKVTVEFSNIDFLLCELLGRLLLTPSFLSRTYTDMMNISIVIKKINNAIDIHKRRYNHTIISENTCSEIKNNLIEVEQIRQIRNKFAHYCWGRDTDNKIFGTGFSSKQGNINKPNEGSFSISNDEIQNLYNSAYEIVEKLDKLVFKLPELVEDSELKNKLHYPN